MEKRFNQIFFGGLFTKCSIFFGMEIMNLLFYAYDGQ